MKKCYNKNYYKNSVKKNTDPQGHRGGGRGQRGGERGQRGRGGRGGQGGGQVGGRGVGEGCG